MIKIPPKDHKAYEFINTEHLVDIAENPDKVPTFHDAVTQARKWLCTQSGACGAYTYALRANDELWLIRVGPRGGWSRVWNFGRREA